MSFLDELLPRFAPARLFADPAANGAGVAVAVIDTGIDAALLAAKHPNMLPIRGGIFSADRPQPAPYEGKHSTPHGTTVADVLLTIAPGVQLFSADVFGPSGSADVECVLRAIHWAIDEWKCKVLNLSLGVTEQRLLVPAKRQQLLRSIEDGYFKDVLIFAAAHNDHPLTRSYPAQFATPLMSVDKNLFADPLEFAYVLRDQIEFQAHGRAYLGPFAQEPATSWATPHLAGVAARLLSLEPNLKPFEMKTILYWMAKAARADGRLRE